MFSPTGEQGEEGEEGRTGGGEGESRHEVDKQREVKISSQMSISCLSAKQVSCTGDWWRRRRSRRTGLEFEVEEEETEEETEEEEQRR